MGLRMRRHFFALDGPRVRRRNGSSYAKTLFRAGRASRSHTKWVFVCEDTFSRWTGLAFADEMGLRVRRHFFALDGPRVRRRNGSSCAKTLFALDGPRVRRVKWIFVGSHLLRVERSAGRNVTNHQLRLGG